MCFFPFLSHHRPLGSPGYLGLVSGGRWFEDLAALEVSNDRTDGKGITGTIEFQRTW